MGKTIIVSNRLPVKVKKNEEKLVFTPSEGGLATGLGSIYKTDNNIWIGWPGLYFEEQEIREVKRELAKENMSPVFLSEVDIEKFYEGFSNSTLWPLFHYFPNYTVFQDDFWQSYVEVNRLYCKEVMRYAKAGDVIWIHDYQLLLLPQMIRQALPDATIGFFQHIPFPSNEIFRIIPWREELIRGMMGADLIGFHTFDDMRHFLSSASRILGIDNKMGQLLIKDRLVAVDSFPMGIDYEKFATAAVSKETTEKVESYKRNLGNQSLVLSIDRLDYSKGIPERLYAFDLFLKENPEYQGTVSLILLVVPSRDNVPLYKKLKTQIDELVGNINGKYGKMNWTPIYYFYRSLPFHFLSALYTMSDIALVTPLRDGMNLVCKEYIASRTAKTGVLILSEMAGAAKELSDAIIVNPYDIHEIVNALKTALAMPVEEQVKHNDELQNILQRYNIHNWVEMFMSRLKDVKEKQTELAVRHLNPKLQKQLVQEYKKAEKRILFLDYDGTLVPFSKDPRKASPDAELYNILEMLAEDPKNKVVIISGRDKDTLDDWFGRLNLDIIAEHGVWIKEGRPMWSLSDYITDEWKEQIRSILEMFVARTPGSFIETKAYSMVWHYRKADPGLGELRSRELINHLQYLTTNSQIKVLEGNKVIEVKNSDINKGKVALRWLQNGYDFILAAGDDYTDEDMFTVMPDSAYTIKVGFSPSLAKYNVQSCADECKDMRELLKALIISSKQ